MKNIFTFLLLLLSYNYFSQSKKEQIEILTNRVDSLNNVLKTDRNLNNQKELEYKEQISSLQKQLENLNGTLIKTKEELAKKDVELKKSNQELLNKSMEINVLENQINEKEEQIATLNSQVKELKVKLESLSLHSKTDAQFNSTSHSKVFSIETIIKLNCAPENYGPKILTSPKIEAIHPDWVKGHGEVGESCSFFASKRIEVDNTIFLFGDLISPRGGVLTKNCYVLYSEWDCIDDSNN
jgi:hypothetical protein